MFLNNSNISDIKAVKMAVLTPQPTKSKIFFDFKTFEWKVL